MNKKFISLLIITIFILINITSSVHGVNLKNQILKDQYTELSNSYDNDVLKSTKIGDILKLLKDHINKMQCSSKLKIRIHNFLEDAIYEMKENGITYNKNLFEVQNIIKNRLAFRDLFNNHRFLMNFYPDTVEIETTLPKDIRNISGGNQTLEIFIKLYPIVDFVRTTKQMPIRKLYQETSVIWPAIGARIREDDNTVFIIAIGPNIKWDWKLF